MDKLKKFAIYLTRIRWMGILDFLIGAAVLLNEFFSLWDANFFTSSGVSQRLMFLAMHNNFVVLKNLPRLVPHEAAILGHLTAVILFLTAVAIILFIMRNVMFFTATLIFFFYYLSHLCLLGIISTFEYLLPFLYSVFVWLSFLSDHALLQRENKRIQFFGFKVFENKQVLVNVILVASLLLWYVNCLSNNLNQLSNLVGIKTAMTFAIFGIISLWMYKLCYKIRLGMTMTIRLSVQYALFTLNYFISCG